MKSVLVDTPSAETGGSNAKSVPKEFKKAAQKLIRLVQSNLSENEVRAMAADKVASPALAVCPFLFFMLEICVI
jgi:nucleolar protein 9